jgi:hypothetical protein
VILDYVPLDFYAQVNWVGIRELCGRDEQAVAGTDTMSAVKLIDSVLVSVPDRAEPLSAIKMVAADRDKVLTAVYMRAYKPTVEATVGCSQCGSPFDLDFSLKELQASLSVNRCPHGASRQDDGTFLLPSGYRFRLPTGEDELTAIGLSSAEAARTLLERCLLEGDPGSSGELVQSAMAGVAPIFETELNAPCPECGAEESIHFDIQSFLLTALEREKNRLAWEVHRLASAYGWSLGEILSLSRSVRRTYVALVEREMPSRRRCAV